MIFTADTQQSGLWLQCVCLLCVLHVWTLGAHMLACVNQYPNRSWYAVAIAPAVLVLHIDSSDSISQQEVACLSHAACMCFRCGCYALSNRLPACNMVLRMG
jgi:hypothetical protein